MELKDYTIEELKAEIKRRNELAKENKKQEPRCKNCKHLINHPHVKGFYFCEARTWGKTYPRHYSVNLYTKACEKFEMVTIK